MDSLTHDVTAGLPDSKNIKTISVTEPQLKLTVTGPPKRYPNTSAKYTVALENPGTATAHNVTVVVTIPITARLVAVPTGASWRSRAPSSSGSSSSSIPETMRDRRVPSTSSWAMWDSTGSRPSRRRKRAYAFRTLIPPTSSAVRHVKFEVTELKQVIDVGESTTYKIRLENIGSKDATNLLIGAKLTDNLKPEQYDTGTDDTSPAKFDEKSGLFVFPVMPRLEKGTSITMGIRVTATKPRREMSRRADSRRARPEGKGRGHRRNRGDRQRPTVIRTKRAEGPRSRVGFGTGRESAASL